MRRESGHEDAKNAMKVRGFLLRCCVWGNCVEVGHVAQWPPSSGGVAKGSFEDSKRHGDGLQSFLATDIEVGFVHEKDQFTKNSNKNQSSATDRYHSGKDKI